MNIINESGMEELTGIDKPENNSVEELMGIDKPENNSAEELMGIDKPENNSVEELKIIVEPAEHMVTTGKPQESKDAEVTFISLDTIWKNMLQTLDMKLETPLSCPTTAFVMEAINEVFAQMKTHIWCTPVKVRFAALAVYILNYYLYVSTKGHTDNNVYTDFDHYVYQDYNRYKLKKNNGELVEILSNETKDAYFTVDYMITFMRNNGRIFSLPSLCKLVCDTNRVEDAFKKMDEILEVRVAFKLFMFCNNYE
jgi:hypothetical protein